MSDDELAALAGPIGLGPDEKVPNQVRILAAQENLGRLLSVHRPTNFFTRLQWRDARIHVYEQGLVLAQRAGARTRLFRVGRMRLRSMRPGRTFIVAETQAGVAFNLRGWSDGAVLGATVERWLPTHPWR